MRAQAGARDNAIRGQQDGALKVAVTQIAEKGKANKAIIDVLCKSLSLKRSQVSLIAGETSSQKRFLIRGLRPMNWPSPSAGVQEHRVQPRPMQCGQSSVHSPSPPAESAFTGVGNP